MNGNLTEVKGAETFGENAASNVGVLAVNAASDAEMPAVDAVPDPETSDTESETDDSSGSDSGSSSGDSGEESSSEDSSGSGSESETGSDSPSESETGSDSGSESSGSEEEGSETMSTADEANTMQKNEIALKENDVTTERVDKNSENTEKVTENSNLLNSRPGNISNPILDPVLPIVNDASKKTAVELLKGTSEKLDTFSQIDEKESLNLHSVVKVTEREARGKTTYAVLNSIGSRDKDEHAESESEDVKVESLEISTNIQEGGNATAESQDDNTEDGSDNDDDSESSTQDDDDEDGASESDTEEESSGDDDDDDEEVSDTQAENKNENQGASTNNGISTSGEVMLSENMAATQDDDDDDGASESDTEGESSDDDDGSDDEGSSMPENCTEENTDDSDTQVENKNQNQGASINNGTSTSGEVMHSGANENTGSETHDENSLKQKTEVIADKLISACDNSQNSSVKSGPADSASSELSLSEFVVLDALDEDSLFQGIDESELTDDKSKGGTRGGKSLQQENPRLPPGNQPSEKLKELNNVLSSKSKQSSVKRRRKSKSRSPSRDRRGRGTPRKKARDPKTPTKNKKKCEEICARAEQKMNVSKSKDSSVAENVLPIGKENDIASSLEEGEIEDSLESSYKVRRSPRKHPSSHREGTGSRGSRGGVKRRFASPPEGVRGPAAPPRETPAVPGHGDGPAEKVPDVRLPAVRDIATETVTDDVIVNVTFIPAGLVTVLVKVIDQIDEKANPIGSGRHRWREHTIRIPKL